MFVRFVAVSAVVTLCLSGCGSSSQDGFATNSPVGTTLPVANYFVWGPPAKAQVRVSDSSGGVLTSGEAIGGHASLTMPASLFNGSQAPAKGGPTIWVSLQVEDPENLGGGPGPIVLEAEVPQLQLDDIVGVDAVSTLIARYHRLHPELSFEQSARAVYRYLGLPEETNPEHFFTNTDFEAANFYAEAAKAGGVEALLTQLASEVDTAVPGSRVALLEINPFIKGLGLTLAKAVAQHAKDLVFEEVFNRFIGWIGAQAGLSGPGLGDVLRSIEQVRDQVRELSGLISGIASLDLYRQKDSVLVEPRARADDDTRTLADWANAELHQKPAEEVIRAKMESIKANFKNTLALVTAQELSGDQVAGPGLIELYLEGVVARLFGKVQLENAIAHLERSQHFQELVLNLRVEAAHYDGDYEGAERISEELFAGVKLQTQQYPFPFDMEKLILDRGTNLLWTRSAIFRSGINAVDPILTNFTLDGSPPNSWRLPTPDELRTLVSAVGDTGIDQHTNLKMAEKGFLPSAMDGRVIGDWGPGIDLDHEVLSSTINKIGGQAVSATMVNVDNFRFRENAGIYSRQAGRYLSLAFYLVRTPPTVTAITVFPVAVPDALKDFTLNYKATARLSDGSDRDVTDLVRWSIRTAAGQGIQTTDALISNVPDHSGQLTFRTSNLEPLVVSAAYRNIEGHTDARRVQFNPRPFKSVLIHPLRYYVDTNEYKTNTDQATIDFQAVGVRDNGEVVAGLPFTWTSSDSDVSFANGQVVVKRPSAYKTVTITATLGQLRQTATLQLDN